MIIKQSSLEKIKQNIYLPDHMAQFIDIKRIGDHYTSKCPFHDDSTPSLHIFNDHYHCFGCGTHGDIISYEVYRTGSDFIDVVQELAIKYKIELEIEQGNTEKQVKNKEDIDILDKVTDFYHNMLLNQKENSDVINYLKTRNLTLHELKFWKLGLAFTGELFKYIENNKINKDILIKLGLLRIDDSGKLYEVFRNRIIIPIRNEKGKTIAYGGRIYEKISQDTKYSVPKYLNSPETFLFSKSKTLFNLDRAKAIIIKQKHVIVVEGYMDCIALVNAGVENVVAVLGTALTVEHVKLLARLCQKIVLCFDSDSAGQKAVQRSFDIAYPLNIIELFYISVNNAKDPDEYIQKFGVQSFKNLVNGSISLLLQVCKMISAEYDTEESKLRNIKKALIPIILKNPDPGQREIALGMIASFLRLSDSRFLLDQTSNNLYFSKKQIALENLNFENPDIVINWKVNEGLEVQFIVSLLFISLEECSDKIYKQIILTNTEYHHEIFSTVISDNSYLLLTEIANLLKNNDSRIIEQELLQINNPILSALIGIITNNREFLFNKNMLNWYDLLNKSLPKSSNKLDLNNFFSLTNQMWFQILLKDLLFSKQTGNIIKNIDKIYDLLLKKASNYKILNFLNL